MIVGLYEGVEVGREGARGRADRDDRPEAAEQADIIMILVPDETQKDVFERDIRPNLKAGNTLMFAHGFNIHYGQIVPPPNVDVIDDRAQSARPPRCARCSSRAGVPALSRSTGPPAAPATGAGLRQGHRLQRGRASLETTFKDETETDNFGEQAVLCGGVSALIKAGFETLVEAGYQPEMAYFECLHELKLIVDLIYEGGLERMRYSISDTAEFGDYYAGPKHHRRACARRTCGRLLQRHPGRHVRQHLDSGEPGRCARASRRSARRSAEHPIEKVGAELRAHDAVHQEEVTDEL